MSRHDDLEDTHLAENKNMWYISNWHTFAVKAIFFQHFF